MTDQPNTITERQLSYCRALLDERDLFQSPKFFDLVNGMDEGEYTRYIAHLKDVTLPQLSKAKASELIGKLTALPKKANAKPRATAGPWSPQPLNQNEFTEEKDLVFGMVRGDKVVPRGSYCIERLNDRQLNELNFYSVWIDKVEGEIRWSVKQYISDSLTKIARSHQYAVLDAIGQAPAAAAMRYGLEKKRCGICHRKLTNDVSRARGIGPVCAERFGW